MRTVLKASLVCWGVVIAFFLFFSIPFELLSPVAAAFLSLSLGGGVLAWLGLYIYRLNKKEGFEFVWFLARKNGFWLLLLGAVGLTLFLTGGVWFLAPQQTERHLEKGAMPFAAFLVVLFWFSLIFMFLGWAVVCYAQSVGYFRIKDFKSGAGSFAIAILWLAFATLFCSLFLGVINDVFLTLSGPTQNIILGLFALVVTVIGLCAGGYEDLEKLLPEEDIKRHYQKRTV